MLLKDRLRQLFTSYELDIQRVIAEVLELEQQNISYERPRLKDQIDDVIAKVAENRSTRSGKTKILE